MSFVKLNFKETLSFLKKMIKSRYLTFAIRRIDNLLFFLPNIDGLNKMSRADVWFANIDCSTKLNFSKTKYFSREHLVDRNEHIPSNSVQNWIVWRTNSVLDGTFRKKLFLTRNELIRPFVQLYQYLCFLNRPKAGRLVTFIN